MAWRIEFDPGAAQELRKLEDGLLAVLASCLGDPALPGPAVTLVPLPCLARPDMLIEIEGWAMRGLNGERLVRRGSARHEPAASGTGANRGHRRCDG